MLEGLAAWVLNTYVGEYVENLNTDQLSIALLQGAVELDNLPLKKDALKSLDLPLEIKSGFIGKITLQIPVRRLRSEPWVISMEKLYLVGGPLKRTQFSAEEEKANEMYQKEAMLKALEEKWQVQGGERTDSSGSSWLSYGTSLASNILENLQLNVKEVHLRYEDNELLPSSHFACGVVIKSLSAQSTDGGWVPKFVSRAAADMMRKLVDLQSFSVYLDTDAVMLGDLPQAELMEALAGDKYKTCTTQELKAHDYILSPVSAQAKMTRNTSPLPLRSPKSPRITLDILLEQIPISLSEIQYRGLVLWLKEFERHDKQRKHRQWKPLHGVKEGPRDWWKFAIAVHHTQVQEKNQRATWQFVLQRAKDNVMYHKAYYQQLTQGYTDSKLKQHLADMEEEMNFEELKILRELVYEKIKKEKQEEEERTEKKVKESSPSPPLVTEAEQTGAAPQGSRGGGLFQGWFPGWGGWYSRGSTVTEDQPRKQSVGEPPPESDLEIEQEILDVIQNSAEDNTLLRRDAVFAVLNFTLKTGSFSLQSSDSKTGRSSGGKSIIEMECTTISSTIVSRPRTGALKFDISIGGLFLRDRMTEGTIFNTLVAPQSAERSSSRPVFNIRRPMSASLHGSGLQLFSPISKADDGKLFQLTWERKPPGTDADYRLSMQTKPLDIIYNPAAARRVSDFFTHPNKLGLASNPSALQITAAARSRYENLKEQTKVELRQTLDSLLEGEGKQTKRWEVNLDISAPQFIIPEDFCDVNSTMVVLDLGNLRFHNITPKPETTPVKDEDQMSEDDFITPLSSPPNELQDDAPKMNSLPVPDFSQLQDLSESALHQRLYEKYMLELSDLQVLVGRAKDNWRHAHFKGTSHLHVIDRFSISLLLERRLLYTTDPQWPSATLSGTLPSLTVHINEQKVQALRTCGMLLTREEDTPSKIPSTIETVLPTQSEGSTTNQTTPNKLHTQSDNSVGGSACAESPQKEMVEQSRLLMMQFTIREASLQIQSQGKAIAELQVGGVRANLTKRSHASSLAFTVHSLLVVDAVQTFGPDFELLVASHKNLCLDSRSGSMRDSDPNSPVSPQSPQSPQESPIPLFSNQTSLQAVQAALTNTFGSLLNSTPSSDADLGRWSSPSGLGSGVPVFHPMSPIPDSEALITLDIEIIDPDSPSNSPGECGLQIANIQFNNLDVIANQETIVEILGFFKRIMPGETSAPVERGSDTSVSEETTSVQSQEVKTRTEVTADFNKLNILLMRVVDERGGKGARKVATATLSSAKIQATLDEKVYVEGSLGGLQFLDVTPEGGKYQKVFSVGHDPNPQGSYKFTLAPKPDMFKTAHEAFTPSLNRLYQSEVRAFTFTLHKPRPTQSVEEPTCASSAKSCNGSEDNLISNTVEVDLKMASLCYTHCPRLLNELSQCASEFKDYMARLGASLRYAATEVAMGIVHKKSDLNSSLYGSSTSLDALPIGRRKTDMSGGKEPFFLDNASEIPVPPSSPLNIIIDARLESPIIVLPRTPQSSEALVSHLGNITIRNSNGSQPECLSNNGVPVSGETCDDQGNKDRIYIEFKNLNLYSVNVDQDVFLDSSGDAWNENLPKAGTQKHSIPIIYDTTVEVSIDMIDPDFTIINPNVTQNFLLDEDLLPPTSDSIQIENTESVMLANICIATPLNLVISKRVYEQILESMDNLTFDDPVPVILEPRTLDVIEEESPRLEPSMSALKLDGIELSPAPFESFQAHLEETQQASRPLVVRARFDVPEFNVEMRGDFGEGEQGLVHLKLQKFSMNYEKSNPYSTMFDLSLTTLVMEDLLQAPDSKHRLLMVSSIPDETDDTHMKPKTFLSTSCPDSTIISPMPRMPGSLPTSFHEHQQNVFEAHQQKTKTVNIGAIPSHGKKAPSQSKDCPMTPPPSPLLSHRRSLNDQPEHALVHINVVLIDKKSPEYHSEFDRVNRFVTVDFNCLDMTVNLQTWVVVLDFLGMGAKIHDSSTSQDRPSDSQDSDILSSSQDSKSLSEEVVNTDVQLSVNSLSLTLNKPEYELAKAKVSGLDAHLSMKDQNMAVTGQLGSISLRDQSPQGHLYRERFMTIGQQALHFDFFKYGLPDPNLDREYDISLKLRMAQVRYVHTNRFQAETLAFCQHFLQLQDVLGRMRAASAGKKVSETASIGTRLLLDMQADAPVILVPHSSRSTDILVMDLGNLTLTNKFLFDGQQGTIKFMAMPGTNSNSPSISSPGDVVKILPQPLPNNLLSGSQYAQGMTQSLFDECLPPQMDVDPMTSSIYGSLDQDYRSEDPVMVSNGEIYDPTDQSGNGAATTTTSSSSSRMNRSSSMSTDMSQSSSSSSTSPTRPVSAQQRRLMFTKGERTLSTYPTGSLSGHICLLDVMTLLLSDIDLYSAERVDKHIYDGQLSHDMEFPSCVIKRVGGNLLREKCALNLQVERNLEGDISHAVPDFCVKGTLTSVQFSLDLTQYKLVRGILDHNLGEPLEEFQRPLMSHLQDPRIQTVLSGDVWKCISMVIELNDVTVELLTAHSETSKSTEDSLAKLGFIKSRLSYESYSDQSRDVDLVSHEIAVTDTRFTNMPKNKRPNVFANILQPSVHRPNPSSMQMELHFRSTKDCSRFTALLNNMRLMCIVDWLLNVQDFLLTKADNPFQRVESKSSEHRQFTRSQSDGVTSPKPGKSKSPLTVSGGIVTKRGPYIEQVQAPFELRMNVTDTEFVVVEDMTVCDTSAVILKCTAVMSYKPKSNERPLSCSLQSLEVFSCSLEAEEETALSIIDPMTISIELNANPVPKPRKSASAGLLDVTQDLETPLLLEVGFNTMNIRLSYHDLRLFLSILNSLPKLADQAKSSGSANPGKTDKKIQQLQDLGFRVTDCERALLASGGRVNDAAIWLTSHATPRTLTPLPEKKEELNITALELKATSICICFIDDCQDADVPLAEISFNGTTFHQSLGVQKNGKAMFQLLGDYYNRALSGWEPFLEPWRCHVNWEQVENDLDVVISATEVVNFNLTSTLIEQYSKIKSIWMEDFYQQAANPKESSLSLSGYRYGQTNSASSTGQSGNGQQFINQKRRVPFVPFALRNDTGSNLWFLTVTTQPSKVPSGSRPQKLDDAYIQATSWRLVSPGQQVPFFIQDREKMRHKKSHELRVHQLVVKVDGWQRVSPVSVDKVGVYFRHASAELKAALKQATPLPTARIVFDVKQEGSAKKIVTVRSALVLINQLPSIVNVKMENVHTNDHGFTMLEIPPNGKVPIPLRHVPSRLWVKPSDWPVQFCDRAIHWNYVTKSGETNNSVRICKQSAIATPYRFCVAVKRGNYPEEVKSNNHTEMLPGHTITLQPPLVLINLLPMELNYFLRDTDIKGTIKSGKEAALLTADMNQHQHLGILLENFPSCKELNIPPGTTQYKVKLRLQDSRNRQLELIVRLAAPRGGSMRVSISAAYWLVNRSGLPLLFRQDLSSSLAAGQFEEHELARSVSPLLFSYTEKEYPFLCTMRVGTSVHGSEGCPNWCQRFSLESGSGFRQLHVMHRPSNRPSWLVDAHLTLERVMPSILYAKNRLQVYNIGIDVRQGRGRFRDTHIIIFAPRYEIDNRSRHKLAISQRHLAMGKQESQERFLLALPNCKLPYHWPRLDLDQLLCVKLADQPTCLWTGGFTIDRVDSFHVILRDSEGGNALLLKVEVLLEGSTFFVVFTDSEELPPPFRIDNCSEVPIHFYQSKTTTEALRTFVREHTSFNYTWDEPTLPPHITVAVQGGTSASYSMNALGEGEQLCYQNFIYLAAATTFKKRVPDCENDVSCRQLVLDVQHNNHVVFRKKEQGKRSQLWRMTSNGMLEHEGSTPPRDPRKPTKVTNSLVLDIADIAAQPNKMVPLMLKKPDERRRSTQTWTFSQDGRLCCSLGDLSVQAISGTGGLQEGAIAVIGAYPKKGAPVPRHMLISRQRLRPGSGCLSVHIRMDGPTRVLQISDIQATKKFTRRTDGGWQLCGNELKSPPLEQEQDKGSNPRHLNLTLNLKGGVGISLVNNIPEELIYISLQDIQVVYKSTPTDISFTATVANTQIDSQMLSSQRQVMLYVTPQSSRDVMDNTPALNITAHKIPNTEWNAEIFRHLVISMKKLTVQLEEKVLWRLLQFVGYNQSDPELEHLEESEVGPHKIVMAATSVQAKRYYFGTLKININRLALSMITASKLPADLQAIKNSMAIPLVKFEEAKVDLDPFERFHPFETTTFLFNEVKRHYTEELKSQAAKILGSVDFLGNPLGLVNDMAEGISGLIKDGNLGGLVKNVAHGVSNSAAKVTGSLSDGLGTVTMDDKHNQTREQIKEQHGNSGSGHLVAGIKGLGYGLFGGLTSIVSQTYEGTRDDGIEGFFTGLGKGVVGTVTKPVAGVLDFASEAASAVRDTSKSRSRHQPNPIRERRCCHGPGGLLPIFSKHHAEHQTFLYALNENNFQELYVAMEQLRDNKEDSLRALISSEQVYFLKRGGPDTDNIVFKAKYKELKHCRSVTIEKDNSKRFYVELVMNSSSSSSRQHLRQPQVRCDKEKIAQKVAQHILYAKSLYDERTHTLVMDSHTDDMDQ